MKKGISIVMVVFGGILIGRGFFPKRAERLQERIEIIQPENVAIHDLSYITSIPLDSNTGFSK